MKFICYFLWLAGWAAGLCGQSREPASVQTKEFSGNIENFLYDSQRRQILIAAGNEVLGVDPETLELSWTIRAGGKAGKMALSSDGARLFVALDERGAIEQYQMPGRELEKTIQLKTDERGDPVRVTAMAEIPDRPGWLAVGEHSNRDMCAGEGVASFCTSRVSIYANGEPLPAALEGLYAAALRAQDARTLEAVGQTPWLAGADRPVVFEYFQLQVSEDGVRKERSLWTNLPLPGWGGYLPLAWQGNRIISPVGHVWDAGEKVAAGRLGWLTWFLPPWRAACAAPGGASLLTLRWEEEWELARHSLETFRKTDVAGMDLPAGDWGGPFGEPRAVLCTENQIWFVRHKSLMTARVPQWTPVDDRPPAAARGADGVVRYSIDASDAVFDQHRGLVWLSVRGHVPALGNSVVGLDAVTGELRAQVLVGSEPGALTLGWGAEKLFVALDGRGLVRAVDLDTLQPGRPFPPTSETDRYPAGPVDGVAPVEGRPDSVIVSAVSIGADPYRYRVNITVFDGGVPRPRFLRETINRMIPAGPRDTYYGICTELHTENGYYYRPVYRFALEEDGIREARLLSNVPAKHRSSVVMSDGFMYTGWFKVGGDADRLIGFFDQGGVPVVFPEQRRVAIVDETYEEGRFGLLVREYDTDTFIRTREARYGLQDWTFRHMARDLKAVRGAADRIVVCHRGEVLVLPLKTLAPSPAARPVFAEAGVGLRRLSAPVRDIAVRPGTQELIVAVGGEGGANGNSLWVMDGPTGTLKRRMSAGSEPVILAPAPDGRSVYTWLAGEWQVVRHDLETGEITAKFTIDPLNPRIQRSGINDMIATDDGGLLVSFQGVPIFVFDEGKPRPEYDMNELLNGSPVGAFRLAVDRSRNTYYALNHAVSSRELKRIDVGGSGVKPRWLRPDTHAIFGLTVKAAEGRLFSDLGVEIDPSTLRPVRQFEGEPWPWNGWIQLAWLHRFDGILPVVHRSTGQIAVDLQARRLYRLLKTDSNTVVLHEFHLDSGLRIGKLEIRSPHAPLSLEVLNGGLLAWHNEGGELYLLWAGAIPKLPQPVPSSPVPGPPQSPGVRVIDLEVARLVWDASRKLLIGTIPNREADRGDKIAFIDPASGEVTRTIDAGYSPWRLALTNGGDTLVYSRGAYRFDGGRRTELNWMDLRDGTILSRVPALAERPDQHYRGFADWVILPGAKELVLAQEVAYEPVGDRYESRRWLRLYEEGVAGGPGIELPYCESLFFVVPEQPGKAFCRVFAGLLQFSAGESGEIRLDEIPVDWRAEPFALQEGADPEHLAYLEDGFVLDAREMKLAGRLPARGLPAVEGDVVYYLDRINWTHLKSEFQLRAFHRRTFELLWSRQIVTRSENYSEWGRKPVPCGEGCLAIAAASEIYLVDTNQK
jgi:hypothetical protein